jgi:hypothetical protein
MPENTVSPTDAGPNAQGEQKQSQWLASVNRGRDTLQLATDRLLQDSNSTATARILHCKSGITHAIVTIALSAAVDNCHRNVLLMLRMLQKRYVFRVEPGPLIAPC